MSKGSSSPPSYPDPYDVANAQAGLNEDAIYASARVNAVNQYAPWGSVTYGWDGTPTDPYGYTQPDANYPGGGGGDRDRDRDDDDWGRDRDDEWDGDGDDRDGDGWGGGGDYPTSRSVTLSPEGLRFYRTSEQLKNTLGDIALDRAGRLPTDLFSLDDIGSGQDVAQALYDRKMGLARPDLDRARDQMVRTLTERGLPIGSEIWNDEQNRYNQAYGNTLASITQDSVLAAGQEQSRQLANALAERNQNINELSALTTGGPALPMPNAPNAPAYNIAPPNLGQQVGNQYNAAMNAYNAQQANNQSIWSGLLGLGSAGIMAASDRRLKRDIRRVGSWGDVPVYTFRYLWSTAEHIGVMAQDLLGGPHADAVVVMPSGYYGVDYGKLG